MSGGGGGWMSNSGRLTSREKRPDWMIPRAGLVVMANRKIPAPTRI
jgi:hypothetical protein